MATSAADQGAERGSRVAVFLDRDGVINRRAPEGEYITQVSDFELLPGVGAALRELSGAGAALFVATNQRGVARGLLSEPTLAQIHGRMAADLEAAHVRLDGVYVCPHAEGECDCRKPGVGLMLQAQADHPWIDFGRSHMIGDSMRDLEAGHRLGMRLWAVGPDHAAVVSEAAVKGIQVSGSAESLAELVASRSFEL
jgi:D-glycero-D-manno-heptose 1,7-bisphosphate phosphatase